MRPTPNRCRRSRSRTRRRPAHGRWLCTRPGHTDPAQSHVTPRRPGDRVEQPMSPSCPHLRRDRQEVDTPTALDHDEARGHVPAAYPSDHRGSHPIKQPAGPRSITVRRRAPGLDPCPARPMTSPKQGVFHARERLFQSFFHPGRRPTPTPGRSWGRPMGGGGSLSARERRLRRRSRATRGSELTVLAGTAHHAQIRFPA